MVFTLVACFLLIITRHRKDGKDQLPTMIRATANLQETLKFLLVLGGVFAGLGGIFILINRDREDDRMLRYGAWRHLTYGDSTWPAAKPFFLSGLGFLTVAVVGELLTKR